MPWIIGMEDYRAGFNRTATEEQIEITDAVAWAKDKLNFEADAAQAQILAADAKRGILNCSRQWGKSTTSAIKAVHHAYFNPKASSSSPVRAFVKARNFSKKAEKAVAQLGIRVRGEGVNQCSIQLPNGWSIIGLPESEGTIRGFSAVSLLMIDEASRVSDDLYHALRPMLAVSSGSLWLMSTPNGKSGFFYREWSGDKDWVRIKATAEECPRIPAAFLDEERETLSEDMYRQEYGCEFMSGEGSLFDEAEITARLSARVKPLW